MQTCIPDLQNVPLPLNVRGVLLDLDNTLYEYEPCHRAAFAAVTEEVDRALGPVPDLTARYLQARTLVKERIPFSAACHSRLLYFQSLLEDLAPARMLDLAPRLEDTYWNAFLAHMRPLVGMHAFLAQCREKRIKTVIVSDMTTRVQMAKLAALGIDATIDHLITSEEAGVEKPHPDIFAYAREKASLTDLPVVVIGDDPHRDGEGAAACNLPWIQLVHEDTHT